jgi:hypothetical protein
MNTALVKPSKEIKNITSFVRTHLDAVERARTIYLAQIKRAEADYYERMKRVMDIMQGNEPSADAVAAEPVNDTPPQAS